MEDNPFENDNCSIPVKMHFYAQQSKDELEKQIQLYETLEALCKEASRNKDTENWLIEITKDHVHISFKNRSVAKMPYNLKDKNPYRCGLDLPQLYHAMRVAYIYYLRDDKKNYGTGD